MRSLWTLTYATAATTRRTITTDVRDFFEKVRCYYGRMPLVAVIEAGSTNGRLHVHFAADRWIKKRCIRDLWGHGFVHVRGSRPGRQGWTVKHLARYLAKYVSKGLDEGAEGDPEARAEGAHRYLLTQGFTPTAWTWRFRHADYGWAMAEVLMGAPSTVLAFGEEPGAIVCGWWIDWPDPLE